MKKNGSLGWRKRNIKQEEEVISELSLVERWAFQGKAFKLLCIVLA